MRSVRESRGVIARLVTVGVLVTWVLASVTIMLVTDLSGTTAWMTGAILVVSGPTVVIPILRRTQPTGPSADILEWEGILIDPVGAMLSVVMLGVVIEGDGGVAAIGSVIAILGFGTLSGLIGAVIIVFALSNSSLSATLRAPVALGIAVAAYTVANLLAPEAGLVATTVAGIALANQQRVDVRDVAVFEEGIGVLVLGSLFVVLGARVSPSELTDMIGPGLILLAVLVVVARPLGVLISTLGSGLDRASTTFMVGLAPRGIVAAATASVFALELEHEELPGSDVLVPLTFVVIVGAGLIYGLGAGPLARRLGLTKDAAPSNSVET